jgi:hypothetical protein
VGLSATIAVFSTIAAAYGVVAGVLVAYPIAALSLQPMLNVFSLTKSGATYLAERGIKNTFRDITDDVVATYSATKDWVAERTAAQSTATVH